MSFRRIAEEIGERRVANATVFRGGRPSGSRSAIVFCRWCDVVAHSLVDIRQGVQQQATVLYQKTHATTQLRNGQLVCVPPILIRRLKSHFVSLPCNVDLILGLNGYIWVSKHIKQNRQPGEEGLDAESVYSNQNEVSLHPRNDHKPLRSPPVGFPRRSTRQLEWPYLASRTSSKCSLAISCLFRT